MDGSKQSNQPSKPFFRAANVIKSNSSDNLSGFTSVFPQQRQQIQKPAQNVSSAAATASTGASAKADGLQTSSPLPMPNEPLAAYNDFEPPRKRRKIDDTPVQASIDDIPEDISIKDSVSFRTRLPLPPTPALPPYFVFPGEIIPSKFLDLCLASSRKQPHNRLPAEVPIATFWETRRANWQQAFRSLKTQFLAGKCEDFYVFLRSNCICCRHSRGEKHILVSSSTESFREMLTGSLVDFTLPLYQPRDTHARVPVDEKQLAHEYVIFAHGCFLPPHVVYKNLLESDLTQAGRNENRSSKMALLIDNQPESLLKIDTLSQENVANFFARIELLVMKNADPLGQNMLALEDLPVLVTTSTPFACCSTMHHALSVVTAKEVDASGSIFESNQLVLKNLVLPHIWRSLTDGLLSQSLTEFSLVFNTEAKSANLNLRTPSQGEVDCGCIQRMEVQRSEGSEKPTISVKLVPAPVV